MKSIKNILVFTCIAFSYLMYAQKSTKTQSVSAKEMTETQLEKINKKIELDDSQKALFKTRLTKLNTDREKILNSNEDQEIKKEKLQQLNQSYSSEFQEILSSEQYDLYLEVKKETETNTETKTQKNRKKQRNKR